MAAVLHLLGAGLDAIVSTAHTVPSPEERLERYHRALAAHPAPNRTALLRHSLGLQYQRAWSKGFYPNLRAIRALMPRGAAENRGHHEK